MSSDDPYSTKEPLVWIACLRTLVGYLASKGQNGWWESSFLDETGQRFLANVFPRTSFIAGKNSTIEVAQKEHDKALGKRGCYHLFRLPVEIEDRLMAMPTYPRGHQWQDLAMPELEVFAKKGVKAPPGPVQVGVAKRILTIDSVSEMAAHYHSAFVQGIRCYPYFQAANS